MLGEAVQIVLEGLKRARTGQIMVKEDIMVVPFISSFELLLGTR